MRLHARHLIAAASVIAGAASFLATPAAAESVDAVPDPRPAHHAVDLTGTLTAEDIAAIDEVAARSAGAGELLVAVVRSTDGRNPREWTTALFNRLALDTRARNRGVILVAALSDRKAEIVVGDGFPAGVERLTDDVMGSVVVANFKAGEPRAALVEGARALETRVIGWDGTTPSVTEDSSPTYAPSEYTDPTSPRLDDPFVLFGGAAGAGGLGLVAREILRRRPRSCATCKVRMGRLGEEEDDKHLGPGERAEERLGSVDYDIWSCPSCGEVLKTRWGAIFTRYSKCSMCSWRTMRSTSRTLQAATEHSTGLAEVTDNCEHCGHHHVYTRTIPRVQRSSSSSRSSGGGSSSGRGSSGSW